MRRTALLGLTLLLPGLAGCNGFLHFVGDTSGVTLNRNGPIGGSENMRRARGQSVDIPPLRTEPGDVWPGPTPPEPTLSDLQREQNAANPPPGPAPSIPRSDAGAPGAALPAPALPARPTPGLLPRSSYTTPGGPVQGTPSPSGRYDSLTAPNGGSGGIAIPNGNGTSTVIAPDGSVTTVPTPR